MNPINYRSSKDKLAFQIVVIFNNSKREAEANKNDKKIMIIIKGKKVALAS